MTTGKTIALTRRTFVGKVMSLLINMLSRLVWVSKMWVGSWVRRLWSPAPTTQLTAQLTLTCRAGDWFCLAVSLQPSKLGEEAFLLAAWHQDPARRLPWLPTAGLMAGGHPPPSPVLSSAHSHLQQLQLRCSDPSSSPWGLQKSLLGLVQISPPLRGPPGQFGQ